MVKLTPILEQQVCALIMAGAFPHIAAQACGIEPEKFDEWLNSADTSHQKKYRSFRRAVRKAQAMARASAETRIFEENPAFWLKAGPGRDSPDSAGWTTPIKPRITENNQQINVLLHPQMQGLFAAILQVLAPFPEARAAVAQALAGGATGGAAGENPPPSLPASPQ